MTLTLFDIFYSLSPQFWLSGEIWLQLLGFLEASDIVTMGTDYIL